MRNLKRLVVIATVAALMLAAWQAAASAATAIEYGLLR
ncbi:MAG: hypothetical protein V7603_1974 [Micromonosporaceae bacterium]